MIVLLNGAFGIGKTTVAHRLVARLPGSLLFDPEWVGFVVGRARRWVGRPVDDYQSLPSWRRLTVLGIRAARALRPHVIVPMAFSDRTVLDEIRAGAARVDPTVLHFCLVAPLEVVEGRLRARGVEPGDPRGAWPFRRAAECCAVHGDEAFAEQVPAADRGPDEIVGDLLERIRERPARHGEERRAR